MRLNLKKKKMDQGILSSLLPSLLISFPYPRGLGFFIGWQSSLAASSLPHFEKT